MTGEEVKASIEAELEILSEMRFMLDKIHLVLEKIYGVLNG